jgi:hypothetical protein
MNKMFTLFKLKKKDYVLPFKSQDWQGFSVIEFKESISISFNAASESQKKNSAMTALFINQAGLGFQIQW